MSLPGALPVWAPLAKVSVWQGRRFPHLPLGMEPLIFEHLAIFPHEERACPCSQSILSYWLAHEQWRYHHFAPTMDNSEAMAFWIGFAELCWGCYILPIFSIIQNMILFLPLRMDWFPEYSLLQMYCLWHFRFYCCGSNKEIAFTLISHMLIADTKWEQCSCHLTGDQTVNSDEWKARVREQGVERPATHL